MHDKHLVAAYKLDGNGGGELITWDESLSLLQKGEPVWLHLDASEAKTKTWLKQYLDNPIVAQALLAHDSRPRCLLEKDSLFMNLRAINLNPGQDPEDMVSVRILLSQHCLITCRQRRLLSIEDIRSELVAGNGPKTLSDILLRLIERVTDRVADYVDTLDDHLEALEDTVSTAPSKIVRPQIANSRREITAVRKYLAPQREALNRLYISDTSMLTHFQTDKLRELYERLARLIEDLDALRDRATIVQEELSNRLSELLDKRMYTLALVTVIFLPISFITSLLGVNLGGIPGANAPLGFWILCTMLLVISVGTGIFIHFKRWF